MIETRIDDCVAFGFQAVPFYKTRTVEMANGREQRNIDWTKAKRRYSALYKNWKAEEFALLLDVFHACRGSAYAFRMRDPTDYVAEDEPLGTTPGANQTPVQLSKRYSFGGQSVDRIITKPNLNGTLITGESFPFVLYENGVAKAGSLDTTTGLFTPTTNWTAAATLTWSGTFDVAVRFYDDSMPASYDSVDAINTTCELIEVFGE